MNPYDFFAEAARRAPARRAFVDEQATLSYGEAAEEIARFAHVLREAGVAAGTRVAVLSPNCTAALVAALAVFRLGAIWVPLNTRNSVEQNALYLQGCGVVLLAFHAEMAEQAGLLAVAATVQLDAQPEKDRLPLPTRMPDSARPCVMLSTGGTTGSPKAVVWSERVVQAMVLSFWAHVPCEEEPAVYLAATPLTHAAGVIAFCLLARGATVLIHRGVSALAIMETIQRDRVTHLFLPPTAVYSMLAHPQARSFDYGSLRAFIYSAAPMAAEKIREAVEVFGPSMVQLYGQAEVPLMCTALSAREHLAILQSGRLDRLRSCGRPTLLVQIEIMDAQGHLLAHGETGEVVVRGDLVMEGYHGDESAESAEASRFGWHHTGDVGHKDEEGYVFIVDRLKDMIITGGFNVFSSEVEQVVLSHPAVQDCAVVGQPDEHWGEAVTAVLQLKPGAQLDIWELRALCRERLGGVKAPKHFLVWDDLPRSPVGKVLKREVRERFWQGRERRV